jgi:phosphomannomutase
MIASISGIRGILNKDVSLADFARFASNFARLVGSDEFLVARDTRSTGDAIRKAVVGALLSHGAEVVDCGVISTPALFRESLVRMKPAIMVTASHNEPEFNGLKFIKDGLGADEEMMHAIVSTEVPKEGFRAGRVRRQIKTTYNDDLVRRFGEGSFGGVRVALDLGGGTAINHAVQVLRRLGCDVVATNDSQGVFNRAIDPVKDELTLLRKMTSKNGCDVGLGFDCDGDRLVIVDCRGRKRTGDYMLTLAISRLLQEADRRDVVVSVDTTVAVDEVVSKLGGDVYRSKVGEANVVEMMRSKNVEIGGEGSSGGLIDGSFNYCRDSMLAALLIIKGLEEKGRRFYDSVKSYHQVRGSLPMLRKNSASVVSKLAKKYGRADVTDGIKLVLSKNSWVLIRPSNTEDVVRVSAEAESEERATRILKEYSEELRELSGLRAGRA